MIDLVSPRKGAVLICAEYQGSNARIAPQNDEYNNEEYDTNEENDKISTKPEKVKDHREATIICIQKF